jgi:hypothetical protein
MQMRGLIKSVGEVRLAVPLMPQIELDLEKSADGWECTACPIAAPSRGQS